MGPSDKAYAQVKNILGKLGRDIDQVRQRRLTPEPVPSAAAPARDSAALPADMLIGVPKAAPAAAAPAAPRSAFGRAQPLIPDPPASAAVWKKA